MSKRKTDVTETEAVEVEETVHVEKVMPATVLKETPKPVVYLGPNIPGVVRHGTVFANGILPKALQKTVSEYSPVCRLIVPLDEMCSTTKELKESQSAAARIYALVAKKYN